MAKKRQTKKAAMLKAYQKAQRQAARRIAGFYRRAIRDNLDGLPDPHSLMPKPVKNPTAASINRLNSINAGYIYNQAAKGKIDLSMTMPETGEVIQINSELERRRANARAKREKEEADNYNQTVIDNFISRMSLYIGAVRYYKGQAYKSIADEYIDFVKKHARDYAERKRIANIVGGYEDYIFANENALIFNMSSNDAYETGSELLAEWAQMLGFDHAQELRDFQADSGISEL